jgi:Glycosyltransferase sugar-binding region containing DXD motif
VKYHCFWTGPWSPLASLSLCSLVHTQNEPDVYFWTLPGQTQAYARALERIPSVKIREHVAKVPGELPFANPIQQSDYVRHCILHEQGGIYFDLDVLFLKPIELPGEWAYQWSNLPIANSALLRQEAAGPLGRALLERGRRIGTFYTMDLYSIQALRSEGIALKVHPCEWFDPAWKIQDGASPPNHYCRGFDDFFDRPIQDSAEFFPEALCYHWHNRWTRPVTKHSALDLFWRRFVDRNGYPDAVRQRHASRP